MKIKTITIELTPQEVVLLGRLIGQLPGEQYTKVGFSLEERDALLRLGAELPVILPAPKAS
jgi:hypothetical protein